MEVSWSALPRWIGTVGRYAVHFAPMFGRKTLLDLRIILLSFFLSSAYSCAGAEPMEMGGGVSDAWNVSILFQYPPKPEATPINVKDGVLHFHPEGGSMREVSSFYIAPIGHDWEENSLGAWFQRGHLKRLSGLNPILEGGGLDLQRALLWAVYECEPAVLYSLSQGESVGVEMRLNIRFTRESRLNHVFVHVVAHESSWLRAIAHELASHDEGTRDGPESQPGG